MDRSKVAGAATALSFALTAGCAVEFNVVEARAQLVAAAGDVQTCKSDDQVGSGEVLIVFDPNGAADSAALVAGSRFAGTQTGTCVEDRFRRVRVPPFTGGVIRIIKHFEIR